MTLTLCIALHLYTFGAQDSYIKELHSECSTVTLHDAMPIVASCAQAGPERCEVITDPKRKNVVLIERKVTRR